MVRGSHTRIYHFWFCLLNLLDHVIEICEASTLVLFDFKHNQEQFVDLVSIILTNKEKLLKKWLQIDLKILIVEYVE